MDSRPDIVDARLAEPVAGYESFHLELSGGAGTTMHVARFERGRVAIRIVALDPPAALAEWCSAHGHPDAMIGGFFLRPQGTPLGELRIDDSPCGHVPFSPPWHRTRACVHVVDGRVALAPRDGLPKDPRGDLLQAGPMLVRDGRSLVAPGSDPEGFSAGMEQFDSDITAGRYPRAALGLDDTHLIAAVCDGRAELDRGLTLDEMAAAMRELGAAHAINLDGGGSASLVLGGRLRNRPREDHGIDLVGGRPISTALVFTPS